MYHTHTYFVLYSFSDDIVFYHIAANLVFGNTRVSCTINYQELKRHAILLSLGEDPSSTTQVDVDLYKVNFFYIDAQGEKGVIDSDSHLEGAIGQFNQKSLFKIKIFASVETKKDAQESPTLESAAESATQTVHSATSTSMTTQATHEMVTYIVKLALVGSGGKKGDNSALT
jgi:hypothetical protein